MSGMVLRFGAHTCQVWGLYAQTIIEGVTKRAEGLVTRESGLGQGIVVVLIFVESSIFIVNKPKILCSCTG